MEKKEKDLTILAERFLIDKGLVRGHQSAQAQQIGVWLVDFYELVKNNGVLDDVSKCPNCGSTNRIKVLCKDCGYDNLDE